METNIKILYVDSNKSFAKDFLDFMIGKNFIIKYCTSKKDAYIEYFKEKSDLIIVDSNLNDGNGLGFIKQLKEKNEIFKSVILSSHIDNQQLLDALELKIDKFILKADDYDGILAQIKEINFPPHFLIDHLP